jgi:hypothetical protein
MNPLRRKNVFVALARVPALVAAVVFTTLAAPAEAGENKVTALVPAYFYPTWWSGSPWDKLNKAAAKIPIEAIMNPDSGPGRGPDPNPDYVIAVGELQKAGGKVIGYVSTGFGSRPADLVIADINSYVSWYHVDGIFLDEMSNQLGDLDYASIHDYIKNLGCTLGRDLHVVGNPGIPFLQVKAFLPAADTLVIFEGPLTNSDPNGASFRLYPTKGPYTGLPLWFQNYPPERFANLVFGTPTAPTMVAGLAKAVAFNAGYVFLTDDSLPNPWDTLPAFWQKEVDTIAFINAVLGGCADW